jgi:hypothetical protein
MRSADRRIGSEMKSVGEVMAIGRSFPEALQKAIRMQSPGTTGLGDTKTLVDDPEAEIRTATDRRLHAIYQYFCEGGSVTTAADWSKIDPWFLHHLKSIADCKNTIETTTLNREGLLRAKQLGFSDEAIGKLSETPTEEVRQKRLKENVVPYVRQIDTLAGEYQAETNYLFLSYHAAQSDLQPSPAPPTIVIGSGPYSIGSSVEFDWCAVNTARTLRKYGEPTIIINSNPETVSTDYDESDRLYFEELSLERVQDIADFERSKGIIVSAGGQTANNLAMPLHRCGYTLLGTSAVDIDRAENRQIFSSLLNDLKIDKRAHSQAGWGILSWCALPTFFLARQ